MDVSLRVDCKPELLAEARTVDSLLGLYKGVLAHILNVNCVKLLNKLLEIGISKGGYKDEVEAGNRLEEGELVMRGSVVVEVGHHLALAYLYAHSLHNLA